MKKLPFFLLILLLVIICVHSQGTPPPPQFPLPSMMRYMLQWPPTVCMTLTPGRPCKQPIPQEFLLHGLWPSDQHGNVMAGSPKPKQYKWDADLVRPLERELEPFWRSLKENFNNMGLYKHEFKMHGVWAQTGVEEYFKTAIRINNNLFNQVNLYNHLRTSNIIASDTTGYSRKDIVEASQKVFGSNVQFNIYLTCTSINRIFYLNEVTFCTNPGGTQFISCPVQPLDPLRHCPDNAMIFLPLPTSQPSPPPSPPPASPSPPSPPPPPPPRRVPSPPPPPRRVPPPPPRRVPPPPPRRVPSPPPPRRVPSPPPPPRRPPQILQEEVDMTYPTFERSWVKYIFNG